MFKTSGPLKKPENFDANRMLMLKQMQIDSLLEITNAISNNYSADVLFRIYEFTLRAQMGVHSLVIFHHQEKWRCVGCYGVDADVMASFTVEKDLIPFKDTILVKEEPSLEVLQQFEVLLPIYHKDVPLAFVLIGDIRQGGAKDTLEEKINYIQTISNIIVVAIENKRLFKRQLEQENLKKELALAEQVQNMLVPNELPKNAAVHMDAVYMPHHNIGGDYYDYIPLNENEFVVCMADISGKGVAAAILMANAQAVFRAMVEQNPDQSITQILKRFNSRLTQITQGDKFITFFLGKHNIKERSFTYINAGHNPPFLILPDGRVEELDKGCTILGVFDELPKIEETTLTLDPYSLIFTYTDGVTDTENGKGEYFDPEKLADTLLQNRQHPVDEINKRLLDEINSFKGNHAYTDDISILTYRLF